MQMHTLKFTKPNSNETEQMMDMNQVIDDYEQTDTLKYLFNEWIAALHNPAKKH